MNSVDEIMFHVHALHLWSIGGNGYNDTPRTHWEELGILADMARDLLDDELADCLAFMGREEKRPYMSYDNMFMWAYPAAPSVSLSTLDPRVISRLFGLSWHDYYSHRHRRMDSIVYPTLEESIRSLLPWATGNLPAQEQERYNSMRKENVR